MEIVTVDKSGHINNIAPDTGARVGAVERWERIPLEGEQRYKSYGKHYKHLTEDIKNNIISIEKQYVILFGEWEISNITDEEYSILQQYLPFEYFLAFINMFICARYNYCIKETFENSDLIISGADKQYLKNFLDYAYKPTVSAFVKKCNGLRTRQEIYDDLKEAVSDPDADIGDLLVELNNGFDMLLDLYVNGDSGNSYIEDIFGDVAPYIIKHFCQKTGIDYSKIDIEHHITQIAPTNFFKMYNSEVYKAVSLANTVSKSGKKTKEVGVMGEISVASQRKILRIQKDFEAKFKAFRPSTTRLMTALQGELTANPGNSLVRIPTKDYITSIGKNADNETDLFNAMKTISEDLDALHLNASSGNLNMELVATTAIDKEFIYVRFNEDYVRHCIKSPLTHFPRILLDTSQVSDTAMYLGKKLSDNYFIDGNANSQQCNIISVSHLLEAVPTIQREEDVSGRQYNRLIVEPFISAMDSLVNVGVLRNWEFCNAKKKPLTDEQCANYTKYKTFITLYVLYDLEVDDATKAEQEARRAKAADKKKAAEERRKAKEDANLIKAERIRKQSKKKA